MIHGQWPAALKFASELHAQAQEWDAPAFANLVCNPGKDRVHMSLPSDLKPSTTWAASRRP
jgi:hypothetical protein